MVSGSLLHAWRFLAAEKLPRTNSQESHQAMGHQGLRDTLSLSLELPSSQPSSMLSHLLQETPPSLHGKGPCFQRSAQDLNFMMKHRLFQHFKRLWVLCTVVKSRFQSKWAAGRGSQFRSSVCHVEAFNFLTVKAEKSEVVENILSQLVYVSI